MPRPIPLAPKKRVTITIKPELYDEIREISEANLRAFSAQVEMLLRKGLDSIYEKSNEQAELLFAGLEATGRL